MNEQLTNKVLEIVTQLQNSVASATKESMTLALQAISYDCLVNIIFGVIFLAITLSAIKPMIRLWKKILSTKDKHGDINFLFGFVGVITSIIWAAFFMIGFFKTIDPWSYIAISNPKVYLAHEVIEKIIKTNRK